MNTVSATEVKRRGICVLEEHLKMGPVHIIKNNHLACVVLTEEDYQRLTQKTKSEASKFNLSFMIKKPATGKRSRKDIDKQISHERANWNEE